MVEEFISALQAHFAKEETFLERVGYEDVEKHKQYHQSLLTKAKELKRLCDEEGEGHKIEDCYTEAVDFLIDDVVRGDSAFKSYIQFHGFPGSED